MPIFQDPVAKTWWMIGGNFDEPGCFVNGLPCPNIYSSPDLVNWTFVRQGTEFIPAGQALPYAVYHDMYVVVYNVANKQFVAWTRNGFGFGAYVYTANS